MARFRSFDDVVRAVPGLMAAGIDVPAYLRRQGVLTPELRAEMERAGPVARPRVRDHRDRRPPRQIRLRRDAEPIRAARVALPRGEYDLRVKFQLQLMNEVLASLYDVHAIPREVPGEEFDPLFGPDALRPYMTGIADGVSTGMFHLAAAPTLETRASVDRPILTVPFRLDFVRRRPSPGPGIAERVTVVTYLSGVIRVMVAVDVEVADELVRFRFPVTEPPPIPGGATLAVAADSPVQPISAGELDDYILDRDGALRTGLAMALDDALSDVSRGPSFRVPGLGTGKLELQRADIRVHGGETNSPLNDTVSVGLLIGLPGEAPDSEAGDPDTLGSLTIRGTDNVAVRVHSSLVDKTLQAAWFSGELQAAADEAADDFQAGVSARVDGVHAEIDADGIKVRVELFVSGFCASSMNIVYALDLVPTVADGEIVVEKSDEMQGIGAWEGLLCFLSGIATFGIGLLVAIGRLLWMLGEYLNTGSSEPAPFVISAFFESPLPVPGTELRPLVEVTRVTLENDAMTSGGVLVLEPDDVNTYVYARFVDVSELSEATPIAGATVKLLDLDRPPPPNDDVVRPETGTVERRTQKRIITVTTRFAPSGSNQLLGTSRTDSRGRVRFVVMPEDMVTPGGTLITETLTQFLDQPDREPQTSVTQRKVIEERPDLFFRLRRADETTSSAETPAIVNVAEQHIGTGAEPLQYRFGGPINAPLDPV